MNGVMTGIIEVKLASHGALDELVESPPFQGGIYGFEPHTHHQIGKYVVTFRIKQSHFTLDIGEHIKDSMNEITIEIPVDKEYYDSVSVGDTVNDDFRVGSLIMHGSFGNWKVTVDKKEIR